jgi:hypothetical protein
LVTSCASTTSTTKIKTVWRDANYQGGHLKKILVIGVSKKPALRRLFEDEFVGQLKMKGAGAVASYTILPSEQMLNKEVIVSKIEGLEIDAVLITRLIERRKERQSVAAPRHRNYYGHYNYSYNARRTFTNKYVTLESNIYETESENLIWSAVSDTWVIDPDDETIRSFIKVITDNLSEEKLLT